MQRANLDGVELAYEVTGSGEPLVLIHGGFIADTYLPLIVEPALARRYSLIRYHRRGYGGSQRATAPVPIQQQAADIRSLLRHLGVERAHVAGHSYGGAIAIQLALDTPAVVASLTLLEPALVLLPVIPSAPKFGEILTSLQAMNLRGDRLQALDAFLMGVFGPAYRSMLDQSLPQGTFEQAIADSDTAFREEVEPLREWSFTARDAAHIRQPVLSVVGEESDAIFDEIHSLLASWIPHAEALTVPRATHALQIMNPRAIAVGLAAFLDRHPL